MRVRYHTIIGGFYEGELINVTVPVKRLCHTIGTEIEIPGYDIQIKQDDGSKVTFENVKLKDVRAVTNCIKCKHCIIEKNEDKAVLYSCWFRKNTGISGAEREELHLFGDKACTLFNIPLKE